MDNLNQWIDDRQSFERARHPQKKKKDMEAQVRDVWWNPEEAPMPEPVCKSQVSGG